MEWLKYIIVIFGLGAFWWLLWSFFKRRTKGFLRHALMVLCILCCFASYLVLFFDYYSTRCCDINYFLYRLNSFRYMRLGREFNNFMINSMVSLGAIGCLWFLWSVLKKYARNLDCDIRILWILLSFAFLYSYSVALCAISCLWFLLLILIIRIKKSKRWIARILWILSFVFLFDYSIMTTWAYHLGIYTCCGYRAHLFKKTCHYSDGSCKKYNGYGDLREEIYKNGEVESYKEYYKNGALKNVSETEYTENGKRKVYKEYDGNGLLKRKTNYDNGYKQNFEYYSNGVIKREKVYKTTRIRDRLHEDKEEIRREYYEDGKIKIECYFEGDNLCTHFDEKGAVIEKYVGDPEYVKWEPIINPGIYK